LIDKGIEFTPEGLVDIFMKRDGKNQPSWYAMVNSYSVIPACFLAGIQANSDWTPDKNIRGDSFETDPVGEF
jgi:hypothetical protein